MAIPFYEPKTTTTNQNNLNNSSSANTTTNMVYDQVDGIGINATLIQPTITNQVNQISAPPLWHTTWPSNSTSMVTTTILTPPPSPPVMTSTSTATSNLFSEPELLAPIAATTPSFEQQALAWKVLALAMCKALREYYLQTSSSKDAFTTQTVHVLPNGQIQPLWK